MECEWTTIWTAVGAVATAIAALGTFIAVYVALRLAGRDERRAQSEAMLRARLSAASITQRLKTAHAALGACLATLAFKDIAAPPGQPFDPAIGVGWISDYVNAHHFEPTRDDLVALIPLDGHCAHRIASAFDNINIVRNEVRQLPAGARLAIQDSLNLERWRNLLNEAATLLMAALDVCEKESFAGAPRLTPEELNGPDLD